MDCNGKDETGNEVKTSVREIKGTLVSESPLTIEHAGKKITFADEIELREYIRDAKCARIGFVINRDYADKWQQFPFSEKDPWQAESAANKAKELT